MHPIFTLMILLLASTLSAAGPVLLRRGGQANVHTCLKNEGSGFVCDSQTNIPNCNTAVNTVCSQVANVTTNGSNQCYSNTAGDCYAAHCIAPNIASTYDGCVAGFQQIMSDCIDPAGPNFELHKQGGDQNIHFDDTSAGTWVDKNQPAWTIGASKCFGQSGVSVINIPVPGGVVYEA